MREINLRLLRRAKNNRRAKLQIIFGAIILLELIVLHQTVRLLVVHHRLYRLLVHREVVMAVKNPAPPDKIIQGARGALKTGVTLINEENCI